MSCQGCRPRWPAGAPLTLARVAPAAPPRVEVPAAVRDLDIASGCAADYDGWLTEVLA